MRPAKPTSKTVTIDEARQQLDQLMDEVAAGDTHTTIEKDGKALARLEPVGSPKQREIDAMLRDSRFREFASIGLAFADTPLEELEAEVARALEEGRKRRREARQRRTP